ncbi:MAG: hemerythrin domain-containing protein [Acidimicrobiaceae bacterium]|nr:hemerythrin domain-containing protein [Acidimicrobiaceae bacterium]
MPTAFLRAVHGSLRPSVGGLARTAAGLGRWSARSSPQRLAAAVGTLENEILPWLAAEQQLLYPVAEQRLGGPMAVAALREAYVDLRRRAESLSALVSRLHDRPPTAAELDALRAGLYGLWAILGQYLSIEETTVFSALDTVCAPGELDDLVAEVARVAGRDPCGGTGTPGRLTFGDVQP